MVLSCRPDEPAHGEGRLTGRALRGVLPASGLSFGDGSALKAGPFNNSLCSCFFCRTRIVTR